jgi:hypothetical protein
MPASVLVAVLVVAGVLSLLPSLVRRFDRAERADRELRTSSMRVLPRRRRRRTVPGRTPVAPPSAVLGYAVTAPAESVSSGLDAEAREAVVAAVLDARDAARAEARAALADEAPAEARAALAEGVRAEGAPAARPTRSAAGSVTRRVPRRPADPDSVQRWWRFRRRRVLALLTLLVAGQGIGVALVGPGFWTGLGLSAVFLGAYVLHLRGAAAAERRRRERLRLRRRRARILAHEAALAAGVAAEVEAMVAEWLATPRQARREPPPEEVVAVLAAGGQEVVQADDGTWYPREVPLPLYVTAPRAPAPPVAPPVAPPARPAASTYQPPARDAGEDDLPRAVNL